MNRKLWGTALTIFAGSVFLFNAERVNAADFQSPRTAALGGAGHAGPLLNDSIYLNPSYMAFLPTYAVSGNYAWAKFQDGAYHYKIQNASVQDGRSDLFQAGVSYTKRDDGTFFHLSTGKALIPQRLSVGLGGKFFSPSGDTNHNSALDAVFSATGVTTEWVQTSIIVDNIVQSATAKQYGLYRELILGTKFNLQQILLVYVDPHYTPDLKTSSKFGFEAGAEWPLFNDLFLRGGYFRSSNIPALPETFGRGFGMGLGFLAPRVSIDYGVSRVLEPTIGTVQIIGLTIFMS